MILEGARGKENSNGAGEKWTKGLFAAGGGGGSKGGSRGEF